MNSNRLHRLVKLAMDTGEAATVTAAERIFEGYRLAIQTGPDIAKSPTLQASLLTAVNTGRRCFLGGVEVSGTLDVPLQIPWRQCRTVAEAVIDLQGRLVDVVSPEIPRILVGDARISEGVGPFAVRATHNGWCGGVVPIDEMRSLSQAEEFTPAGILAGALGVSEAFQFVRGDNLLAGRRAVGLSLWQPDQPISWLESETGPALEFLPANLWLIGLGHLGQAYLWTLGFLPYSRPEQVQLVLQDFDELEEANESTSLLTNCEIIGRKKTRAMAAWCEERGFRTRILERRFAPNFKLDDEPLVALCGVDNPLARAALEDVGFKRVIEAGLGTGPQEYLSFQIHNFPASRSAQERWGRLDRDAGSLEHMIQQPAYQALAEEGYDQCGLTLLAGHSVGASFVGAVTSTLVIAELLRTVTGESPYEVIDGDLRSTALCRAVRGNQSQTPFNPGLADVYRRLVHSKKDAQSYSLIHQKEA